MTLSASSKCCVDLGTPSLICSFIWSVFTPGIDPAAGAVHNQNNSVQHLLAVRATCSRECPRTRGISRKAKILRTAAEGGDGVGGDGVLAGAHGGGGDVLAVLVVADAHLHEQQLHGRLRPSLGVARLGLGRLHARGDGRRRWVLGVGGSDAEVEAGARRSGGGGRERWRPWFGGRAEEAAGEGCC